MKTLKSSSLNHSMFHIPYSFDILQDNLNTHKKKHGLLHDLCRFLLNRMIGRYIYLGLGTTKKFRYLGFDKLKCQTWNSQNMEIEPTMGY